MNDEDPKSLSDIDINLHGFTADDIIQGRQARMALIHGGALSGNWFCEQVLQLDLLAKQNGLNMDYVEELDDEDLE